MFTHQVNNASSLIPLSRHFQSILLPFRNDLVFLCIGTDLCIGDSLGPLTGNFISESLCIPVYGTTTAPAHAKNLYDVLEKIHTHHQKPYIVAIDACLGREEDIGKIFVSNSPLKPGAALQKELPSVGSVSIKGLVNKMGQDAFAKLQFTRLDLIYQMSKCISDSLVEALSTNPNSSNICK